MERYGIFRRLADGAPMWITATHDLESAKQSAIKNAALHRTECFVFDLRDYKTVFEIGKTIKAV